ncbi:MAG TPA: hypothetical protein VFY52_06005 [Thermoleophilaceae bacterium]|nr:hypothetical protein [Thermoleophilaceae bacterium]
MSHASRRERQLVGLVGFLCAAALPVVLWHRAIAVVATDFRFEFEYLLTGWLGYGLIAGGLLLLVPVVWSAGRRPGSRLYPRARRAYMGWGVSLYIMGFAVAAQVAASVG